MYDDAPVSIGPGSLIGRVYTVGSGRLLLYLNDQAKTLLEDKEGQISDVEGLEIYRIRPLVQERDPRAKEFVPEVVPINLYVYILVIVVVAIVVCFLASSILKGHTPRIHSTRAT